MDNVKLLGEWNGTNDQAKLKEKYTREFYIVIQVFFSIKTLGLQCANKKFAFDKTKSK